MDNDLKTEERKDRAPNPWPVPCNKGTEIERKFGKPSAKANPCNCQNQTEEKCLSTQKNFSDNNSCTSASTQNSNASYSLKSNSLKTFKCSDHQYYKRESKYGATESCAAKVKAVSVRKPMGSKTPQNGHKYFNRNANESNYYSAYSYGKNSTEARDVIFDDDTPSPRGLTRDREAMNKSLRRPSFYTDKNNSTQSEKQMRFPLRRSTVLPISKPLNSIVIPETLKIETRRTIVREGGIKFEEVSVIQFPQNLPRNVQVITAQFVPGNHRQ